MIKLSGLFFMMALIAIIIGSVSGMAPTVVLAAKIGVVTGIILGLISLVGGLIENETKRISKRYTSEGHV